MIQFSRMRVWIGGTVPRRLKIALALVEEVVRNLVEHSFQCENCETSSKLMEQFWNKSETIWSSNCWRKWTRNLFDNGKSIKPTPVYRTLAFIAGDQQQHNTFASGIFLSNK